MSPDNLRCPTCLRVHFDPWPCAPSTPTDPTTLRTALEALVQKWSDEAISAMSNGLTEQAVATEWCASDLRAALATPAPAADEARCGCGHLINRHIPDSCCTCDGLDGPFTGSCAGFQPAPTPAPPTPPATEPVAALVEAFVNDEMMERLALALGGAASSMTEGEFRARLDAIVAAARAEGLDGLTVAMVADAIHPEGQGPTIDCCMGSTVESLYPPDEAARLHRKHHEEAATRFLAYLAARARRAGETADDR